MNNAQKHFCEWKREFAEKDLEKATVAIKNVRDELTNLITILESEVTPTTKQGKIGHVSRNHVGALAEALHIGSHSVEAMHVIDEIAKNGRTEGTELD